MVDADTTGSEALRQAIERLAESNIVFAVSRTDQALRPWLERYDLSDRIGSNRFHPSNRHAAEAFRRSSH